MDQHEIEAIIGRLYLAIMEREKQIAELQARLAEKPAVSPLHAVPKDAG